MDLARSVRLLAGDFGWGSTAPLFCAGQTSVDADGEPLHPGDFAKQMLQAIDHLETVLAKAGMRLSQVARLNYYVTDVDSFWLRLRCLGLAFKLRVASPRPRCSRLVAFFILTLCWRSKPPPLSDRIAESLESPRPVARVPPGANLNRVPREHIDYPSPLLDTASV